MVIPTNGLEDTYNDFEGLYPQELRNRLAAMAREVARLAEPDITEDAVWVSGFSGGYTDADLDATDAAKLARPSAAGKFSDSPEDDEMGFEGDDSSTQNIVGRDIDELKRQKLAIVREMNELGLADRLTPTKRKEGRDKLAELDRQIKTLQEIQAADQLPVYYATALANMREDSSEDNPLAYIGDVPGIGYIAVYDGRALSADQSVRVTYKSDAQIRIAGRGPAIARHILAVLRLEYTD